MRMLGRIGWHLFGLPGDPCGECDSGHPRGRRAMKRRERREVEKEVTYAREPDPCGYCGCHNGCHCERHGCCDQCAMRIRGESDEREDDMDVDEYCWHGRKWSKCERKHWPDE